MEYLIIDGYNVINAWTDLFDLKGQKLEKCRNKLLDILSNFQGYKNVNVIVVFDAHLVKGNVEKQETFDNITVVFTKENETADNFIERFVYKLGTIHRIRVVTYDYLEQRIVLNNGGIRVSPREFKEEISKAGKNIKLFPNTKHQKTNPIMSQIKPEILEILEKMRRDK